MRSLQERLSPGWLAVIGGLLLSWWMVSTDELINNDGIVYLQAADAWLRGEWAAAYGTYPWPLYPILIATLSKVSGIGLETSAYLIDAAFGALLSWLFVAFVRDLGGDRRTEWFACLLILAQPFLIDARPELLRDHGYWALYLLALLLFLRHLRAPGWGKALAWNGAILAAALFRVEGLAIALLLPLLWLLPGERPLPRRLAALGQALALTLATASLVLLVLVIYPPLADHAGRLLEPIARSEAFIDTLTHGLEARTAPLRGMLEPYAGEYAVPGLLLIIALIILGDGLKALSPLCALLLLWPRLLRGVVLPREGGRLLIVAALINLLILLVFVADNLYLQTRFAFPLALSGLLPIPFLLASMLRQTAGVTGERPIDRRLTRVVIALLLLAGVAGMIRSAPDKGFLLEASTWAGEHLPAGAVVQTDSQSLAYYANRDLPPEGKLRFLVVRGGFVEADYIALRLKRGRLPEWAASLAGRDDLVVARFTNPGGEALAIYRRP